ncbi:MAG: hypothetical protein IPM29_10500 [Planctomycetes bacterium]|nr:hypothetical protein [Planctomycetota bacterium]
MRVRLPVPAAPHLAARIVPALVLALATGLPAQAAAGVARAHRLPVSSDLPAVVTGDFSGDGRADALLIRDGLPELVLGVAGFGVPMALPAPGGGRVAHVARIVGQGVRGRDLALLCVADGPAAGLHTVEIDDTKDALAIALGATDWGGVIELAVFEQTDAVWLFGLAASGDTVFTGTIRNGVLTVEAPIALPSIASSIRVAPWQSGDDLTVFASDGRTVHIVGTDGGDVAAITAAHPIHDFDAGLSSYLGHGRLGLVTWDSVTRTSWFELHDPNTGLQQLELLGPARPRMVMRDLLARGDLDVCAVHSNSAAGFAAFGGFGPTPTTLSFSGTGFVPFSFDSPSFGTQASFSNVDLFDADNDGDGDVVFCDAVENAVWVQPSWAIGEFQRAPTLVSVTPLYRLWTGPGQLMDLSFALPATSAGFLATHVELSIYQDHLEEPNRPADLVAHTVVPFALDPGGLVSFRYVEVLGQYEGPQGTHADYIACARFLAADETGTVWSRYGVESFASFWHDRTPDPLNPGFYLAGNAGGVNPLPVLGSTGGIGSGGSNEVPPPPPAPTPGG